MKRPQQSPRARRAYTLIEALVASSILMVGVSAAASMSLSFVTQEEIGERAAKAYNYLDNAVALYRAGMNPAEIPALLPPEPIVISLAFTDRTLAASSSSGASDEFVPSVLFTVTWKSTGATATTGVGQWTGGSSGTTRSASVEVVRTDRTVASPLPRVDFFD